MWGASRNVHHLLELLKADDRGELFRRILRATFSSWRSMPRHDATTNPTLD